jgi:hypothetical protein
MTNGSFRAGVRCWQDGAGRADRIEAYRQLSIREPALVTSLDRHATLPPRSKPDQTGALAASRAVDRSNCLRCPNSSCCSIGLPIRRTVTRRPHAGAQNRGPSRLPLRHSDSTPCARSGVCRDAAPIFGDSNLENGLSSCSAIETAGPPRNQRLFARDGCPSGRHLILPHSHTGRLVGSWLSCWKRGGYHSVLATIPVESN